MSRGLSPQHQAEPACCDAHEAVAASEEQACAIDALRALARGEALLHPTDTLPGLAFDPRLSAGTSVIARVKGRPLDKPCLGLVADFTSAKRFFAPLPPSWEKVLLQLWPGPLSVVWTASRAAPPALVHTDGTIGLRVPVLQPAAQWLFLLMRGLDLPLPTTSVNVAGSRPAESWAEAVSFAESREVFVPDGHHESDVSEKSSGLPSTIIRLHAEGSYTLVRAGALTAAVIDGALA